VKYLIFALLLSSTSAFAHEEYQAGICFLSTSEESVNSVRYANMLEHVDYVLSVDSEQVRSVDVSTNCDEPNTTCKIDSGKAKKAMSKLKAMAQQLKSDGVCKSIVDNID
jgi:hypothetical protein